MDSNKNEDCPENPVDSSETKGSEEKESRWGDFSRIFTVGNMEVTFNSKILKSPVEILEKLYYIWNDKNLTNEEKSNQVEKVMKEYME